MIMHDYECVACKRIFESMVEVNQRQVHCLYCGGVSNRVLLKAPGFNGKNKGLFPYFDIQSGETFQSTKDRDDYAKKDGRFRKRDGPVFEMQGPQEWERSRNASKTPNPADSDEPEPWMIETAKRLWDDVKYDRVPKEAEKMAELGKEAIEADVLDVTKAPKIESA